MLLMGTTRLAWWRFSIAAGLSNFGIAAAYAALGNRVQLPVAIAASIALPLLTAVIASGSGRAPKKSTITIRSRTHPGTGDTDNRR